MSDCGVCLSGGDDGVCEFFSSRIVIARKSHRCDECRRTIVSGIRYEYVALKFDKSFETFNTCTQCVEIANAFYCDRRIIGSLWEDMNEIMDQLTTSCFEKLSTAEAKLYLRERWMKWKGLTV